MSWLLLGITTSHILLPPSSAFQLSIKMKKSWKIRLWICWRFWLGQGSWDFGQKLSLWTTATSRNCSALATEPKILFWMSRQFAGMNPQETAELTELIRRIKTNSTLPFMLIEHDMSLVMEVTERSMYWNMVVWLLMVHLMKSRATNELLKHI